MAPCFAEHKQETILKWYQKKKSQFLEEFMQLQFTILFFNGGQEKGDTKSIVGTCMEFQTQLSPFNI